MKYLIGYTVLIRWDGKYIAVNLEEAGFQAVADPEWKGVNFTDCEY